MLAARANSFHRRLGSDPTTNVSATLGASLRTVPGLQVREVPDVGTALRCLAPASADENAVPLRPRLETVL